MPPKAKIQSKQSVQENDSDSDFEISKKPIIRSRSKRQQRQDTAKHPMPEKKQTQAKKEATTKQQPKQEAKPRPKQVRKKPLKTVLKHLPVYEIFPGLPSFHSMITALSYYGYSDKVEGLLSQLSHNTRTYAQTHKDAIRAFTKVWVPEISSMIEYGDKSLAYNYVWPDIKALNKMPANKQIYLKAIHINQYLDCLFLTGIELELSHKIKSRFQQQKDNTVSKKHKYTRIEIDSSSVIGEAQMKVDVRQNHHVFKGIRLIDVDGKRVLNREWDDTYGGTWQSQKIPLGQRVIGVKLGQGLTGINRIGLLLWVPQELNFN